MIVIFPRLFYNIKYVLFKLVLFCFVLLPLQTWSPNSYLTWGCGKHLLECSQKVCLTFTMLFLQALFVIQVYLHGTSGSLIRTLTGFWCVNNIYFFQQLFASIDCTILKINAREKQWIHQIDGYRKIKIKKHINYLFSVHLSKYFFFFLLSQFLDRHILLWPL